jgi:hypothetical protein
LLALTFPLFRKGYNTYYACERGRLQEIIEGKTYYDALFVGSSRTYSHINPKVVDSVLNISSFNAGINGANLLETSLILKCYLASHPAPKYVIVDLSPGAFEMDEFPVFNPTIYYPFLGNKIVYNTLRKFKRVELLKYIPFLQMAECDDGIKQGALAGLIGKKEPGKTSYQGYIESKADTLALPFKPHYLKHYFAVDKKGTALLAEIIDICQKSKIRLFVTYSPVYDLKDEKMNSAFFPTIKTMCDTSLIPFLNYRYLALNKNHLLFSDEHHLNRHGANIFSALLASDIKTAEGQYWNLHPSHEMLNKK